MLINGTHYHSITYIPAADPERDAIRIIDQRYLPYEVIFRDLNNTSDVMLAIGEMLVRGAPLIGITAAFGLYFALNEAPEDDLDNFIDRAAKEIINVRPTAVNAAYCVNRVLIAIKEADTLQDKKQVALKRALELWEEDKMICRKIGEEGLRIIKEISRKKEKVNILTHCNAGWLACVDYGTVTSVIYQAQQAGIDLHVWVDETRPKNQGARLTVWELTQNGVANTLITDNAGGYLMQQGLVDLVLVGCDRVTRDGDVANKIGTYLKALAARDNNIPFYVATPSSTIDWDMEDGVRNIPIENRDANEVRYVEGWCDDQIRTVLITTENAEVCNPGFDVTPAKYVTALITERGLCPATTVGISLLFPERM